MSRIFLSHSSRDNVAAIALRNWMAAKGWVEVFLDLDPQRGIVAGERWERALHEAASRCEAVVFLVSRDWLASQWCDKEYALARGLNKKLLAVLVDGDLAIADLPEKYKATWQVVDLAGGQDHRIFRVPRPGSHEEAHVAFSADGLTRLRRGLEKAGLDPKFFAWPPAAEPGRAPYRGLSPLEAEDAGIFFGRDAPIVEATDRLRGLAAGAAPRLLVLLGASGAGKSSFLRAGLLPRLARDDAHFLPLAPIRPGRAPLMGDTGFLGALAKAFPEQALGDLRAAVAAGATEIRPLLDALVQAAFRRTLADNADVRPPTIVVTIDQAEELFRPEGAAEAATLLALIRELVAVADPRAPDGYIASEDPAVILVFAIRSDSFDLLMRAAPLEGLRQETQALPPMPRGAYQDVIEGPPKRMVEAGGRLAIEPRLTQRLLEDIEKGGGSDALPLLAFTLEQLYREYGAAGTLRVEHYLAFGGLGGIIDRAVARAFLKADADGRIPRERAAREALLRRGLIPWLAGIDPDTRSPRRNIARRSDIPVEAAPLIDLLVDERLLSVDVRLETDEAGIVTRVPTIEPTHEALLRKWGLLAGWLAEDFGHLATLEGVQRAAREWDANARSEDWLSHIGERYDKAASLSQRPDITARFDGTDLAYLASCRQRVLRVREDFQKRRRRKILMRRLQVAGGGFVVTFLACTLVWWNWQAIAADYNWFVRIRPYMNAMVRPYVLSSAQEKALQDKARFRDCPVDCPQMVVIPSGTFLMGSSNDDPSPYPNERPQHPVDLEHRYAIAQYDVTEAQYAVCVATGGCRRPDFVGSGDAGKFPATNVTWNDARDYAVWLSSITGKTYRLPSEAEWERAARGGTTTTYYWGETVDAKLGTQSVHANCNGCGSRWDNTSVSPIGSFDANPYGLYDMAGNVWQWVLDCAPDHDDGNYRRAYANGWTGRRLDCARHYARGGSFVRPPVTIRPAVRYPMAADERSIYQGFRVVRELSE